MSIRSDHKALVFVAAIAVLATGVRVVRAATRSSAPAEQPALERQAQAADSAARAGRGAGRGRGRGAGAASRARGKRAPLGPADSAQSSLARDSTKQRRGAGALDRPGYIAGKLDLDIATASQIDSLPGVTPLMARRIASDRMRRGPFLSRDGLRRVVGAGPAFIYTIDPLITFSGTIHQGAPADSIVQPRSKKRFRD